MVARSEILIVGGATSEVQVQVMAERCRGASFGATTIDRGLTALTAMASAPPTLVLLAPQLPDIDALAMLAEIRANAAFDPVAVVAVLPHDDLKTRLAAIDLGVDDYLLAPFGLIALETCIARAIKMRRERLRLIRLMDNDHASNCI